MKDRLAFIDWMKFLGMGLIVWGHTGSAALIEPTEPFNPKQLGVAFFIFVLGYTLALETRPRLQVFFNRLFPVLLVGLSVALVLSAIDWIRVGDLRESNYLPLFFGINVCFNFFPANPTTWYIGTYTHIILLWALLLYRFRVSKQLIFVSLVTEILIRAVLMKYAGSFIAYMFLTNWFTLLLLGIYRGQVKTADSESHTLQSGNWLQILAPCVALVTLLIVWNLAFDRISLSKGFPFRLIAFPADVEMFLATSLAVSFLYFTITIFVFQITRMLRANRMVEFFARNTLFVFIVHMPMIYALTPLYYTYVSSLWLRIPINLLFFFVIPAIASELLFRVIPLKNMRDAVWTYLNKLSHPAQTAET